MKAPRSSVSAFADGRAGEALASAVAAVLLVADSIRTMTPAAGVTPSGCVTTPRTVCAVSVEIGSAANTPPNTSTINATPHDVKREAPRRGEATGAEPPWELRTTDDPTTLARRQGWSPNGWSR